MPPTWLRDTGEAPANVDDVTLDKVRAATVKLPIDADWKAELTLLKGKSSRPSPPERMCR